MEEVVHLVFVRIANWASCQEDFDSLKVDGVLHNWEASRFDGTPKVQNLGCCNFCCFFPCL